MGKDIVFIVNPVSGKRAKGPERLARVEAFIRRERLNAEARETLPNGNATAIAQAARERGARRVVCVGGDGTINEIGRALVGSNVEFALVPMGSGNGLARHLGLPMDFDEALKAAVTLEARPIDTGLADGRPFFNVMGIGFDAEVGRRFNLEKTRGLRSYVAVGWGAFQSYRSLECEVEAQGVKRTIKAYMVAVANSSQYGSNFFIAPDASTTDGKLNFVAVTQPDFVSALVLVWRLLFKKLYLSPRVIPICAESFTLRLAGGGIFHADGEIFDRGAEFTVRAMPRSLLVASPAS